LEAKGFKNLTASELMTFSSRLHYLVHIGCKPYELVEYPQILLLNEAEIDQRVEKLRLVRRDHRVSIALLMFASPNKSNAAVRRRVARYRKPLHSGYISKVDEVVQELNCSDVKTMEILTRNPRLLGRKYRKDLAEKIRCLLNHGSRHEDLYRNTNVLNNKTLATIRSRANRLHEIGCIPLRLGLIGREDSVFEEVVGQQEAQGSSVTSPQRIRADDVIRLLPPMSAYRITTVRPKIEYLLSEGYAASDIVDCPKALNVPVKSLRMAVCELKPYHVQFADLASVSHYAVHRRLPSSLRCDFRRVIARSLGCSSSLVLQFPRKDRSVYIVKDLHQTATVNAKYLRDELGFTAEELASVPLVLTHAPSVVRRHWNALSDAGDDTQAVCSVRAKAVFRRHANNPRLRLSLLQYCIEKEVNFTHACVSAWTEDSDYEFRVAEAATSASEDGSDTDLTIHDNGDSEDDPHDFDETKHNDDEVAVTRDGCES